MVTGYARARDVLKARLEALFESSAFSGLYPGAKVPRVFLGFPATEPPFYAAVDEIVDAAETSGAVSMGHAEVSFTLHVWLCAQHTSLETASNTLLAYIDTVFGSVMADQQLCGTVDNAFCRLESAGTAADSSRRYIAAAAVGVKCTVYSQCPAQVAQAVAESNAAFLQGEELDGEGNGG